MGMRGLLLKVQNSYPPVPAQLPEVADRRPRNPEEQSASKLLCLSGFVRRKGFFCQIVKLPSLKILFNLPIPRICFIIAKPIPKIFEVSTVKFLDFMFELLNSCHIHPPECFCLKRLDRIASFSEGNCFS